MNARKKALKLREHDNYSSDRDYHEAERAFQLLESNKWTDEESTRRVSPRTRFAWNTLRRSFCALPTAFYLEGRVAHYAITELNPNLDAWNTIVYLSDPLDRFAKKLGTHQYRPAGATEERAYAMEYPASATLDKVVGVALSVPLVPIAAIAGLLYTPMEDVKERYHAIMQRFLPKTD